METVGYNIIIFSLQLHREAEEALAALSLAAGCT
jgi:hypothetical protein